MAMSAKSKMVIEYLRKATAAGQNVTAADLAEVPEFVEAEVGKQSINGIFTSAIQRKGYGYREEAEVQLADGTHEKIKYLRLTEDGMNVDLDADAE